MSSVAGTGRVSRPLVITLATLAGVAVMVALWLLVLSPLMAGDSSSAQEAQATPSPSPFFDPGDDEPLDDDPVDELGALPITTYEVFLARDPFEPVVPLDAGGDGGTDDTGDDGTGGTDDGSGGTDDGTGGTDDGTGGADDGDGGSSGPTGSPGGCSGEDEVTCDGLVVTLVDVISDGGDEQAIVQVDTTLYTVAEGDFFASFFQVKSVDPPCVTLLYGDDAFTLCEGDRVLK